MRFSATSMQSNYRRAAGSVAMWYQLLNVGCRLPLGRCERQTSNAVALGSAGLMRNLAKSESMSPTTGSRRFDPVARCFQRADGSTLRLTSVAGQSRRAIPWATNCAARFTQWGANSSELLWNGQVAFSAQPTDRPRTPCVIERLAGGSGMEITIGRHCLRTRRRSGCKSPIAHSRDSRG